MPAAPFRRQAAVSSWFDKQEAGFICRLEREHLQRKLQGMPTLPWLWLAPAAEWMPSPPVHGRGLRLYPAAAGTGYDGDLRCGLPLPLPSEAVNAIVLQHIAGGQVEPLLEECARVLMPGGRLWLTLFNPCSPYRWHWQGQAAAAPSLTSCRRLLQRLGLRCGPVGHLGPALWEADSGPRWPAPGMLRALCVLEAEKRTVAMVGPGARPRRLPQPVVTRLFGT